MTINAVCYDIECLPNVFTFCAMDLNGDSEWRFEISEFQNDSHAFYEFLNWLAVNDWYMIGYNSISYDYNLVHAFMTEPVGFGPAQFYAVSQSIINSTDRFGRTVWESDRYIKQIDLLKIHHFDNNNKRQSLKGLEVNMRSDSVLESELPFDQPLTKQQTDDIIWPYNRMDVSETKRFALISMKLIEFRLHMSKQITGDVLNFNDTKIGKELLAQRMGKDACYTWTSGRKEPRRTPRQFVNIGECIFPYIELKNPEFRRVLDWMKAQTITETKGAFEDLTATVDGLTFKFGVGGLHGSVERKRFYADDEWTIIDDDVGGYYPSLIIENDLAPEHLGDHFRREFRRVKDERKLYPKGTPENGALKLAGNGVFGDSNNQYGIYFDPKFMITTTVNGQLMLCMLAEWLMEIPTLSIIQANTDGLTYRVHRSMEAQVEQVRTKWQAFTRLELEQARYKRMLIRDVNSYIAETESGKLKLKGAYWSPRNESWCDDIMLDLRNPGPPAFHKDFSNVVVQRAAVEHMLKGTDIASFVYSQTNPFDFMACEKAQRGHKLYIGEKPQGRVTRCYMSKSGEPMKKVMPSTHPHREGQFKQARGVSDQAYNEWHAANGNVWSEAIHTKNHSVYDPSRVQSVNTGHLVRECNHVRSFDFADLDYQWYIGEARKLVI